MNIKTLAAVVGTLSLGALATGCATAKPAEAGTTTSEKGEQAACSTKPGETPAKGEQAACSAKPGETPAKGGQMSCGNSGCGGTKPQ